MDKIRVMLIDDDLTFNFINTNLIRLTGFSSDIQSYTDAEKALHKLENPAEKPDCIFLDLDMPHMDGWEFLDAYHHIHTLGNNNCKVFILTSSLSSTDIRKASNYKEVSEFISKPLDTNRLKTIKRNYFEAAS